MKIILFVIALMILGPNALASPKSTYVRPPEVNVNEALSHGQKTVASAGTAEALAASTPCVWVTVQAKRTNTGRIYIGGASVANDDTAGIMLNATDSASIDTTNLLKVYINATVNGEGVTYVYSN